MVGGQNVQIQRIGVSFYLLSTSIGHAKQTGLSFYRWGDIKEESRETLAETGLEEEFYLKSTYRDPVAATED